MENQYNIDQIVSICKVSKQSIYSLIKKNKAFISDNSTRIHRIVYYNQVAMDFFTSYYRREQTQESNPDTITHNTAEIRAPEGEQKTPVETAQIDKPPEGQQNALQRKIDALEAELEALKKDLTVKEEERKELLRQNGALILTISQLQQEKLLYLPAPKKTISERIKGLFQKQE